MQKITNKLGGGGSQSTSFRVTFLVRNTLYFWSTKPKVKTLVTVSHFHSIFDETCYQYLSVTYQWKEHGHLFSQNENECNKYSGNFYPSNNQPNLRFSLFFIILTGSFMWNRVPCHLNMPTHGFEKNPGVSFDNLNLK